MAGRVEQMMREDSQKNSKASRERLEDVKLEYTQERLVGYNVVFKAFGFRTQFQDPIVLPCPLLRMPQ